MEKFKKHKNIYQYKQVNQSTQYKLTNAMNENAKCKFYNFNTYKYKHFLKTEISARSILKETSSWFSITTTRYSGCLYDINAFKKFFKLKFK